MRLGVHAFRFDMHGIGEGDVDVKRVDELIKDTSRCERINVETDLDIPMDGMNEAMRIEEDTLVRSRRTYERQPRLTVWEPAPRGWPSPPTTRSRGSR